MIGKYATEEVKSRFFKSRTRKHNNPHLAAQLEVIDEGVGMIMEKLDKLGLAENTIVVFTSDNGGSLVVTSNGELRKGDWKLIKFYKTGKIELYNLTDDLSEKNDLAKTLKARKDKWPIPWDKSDYECTWLVPE